jgi:hypothetical protein
MSDVAVYHVFVCALFPVQGGMWTGYGYGCGQSAYLPALETTHTQIHDTLPHHS